MTPQIGWFQCLLAEFSILDYVDDRTHGILRSMAQNGIKGQRIDFLFALLLNFSIQNS